MYLRRNYSFLQPCKPISALSVYAVMYAVTYAVLHRRYVAYVRGLVPYKFFQ